MNLKPVTKYTDIEPDMKVLITGGGCNKDSFNVQAVEVWDRIGTVIVLSMKFHIKFNLGEYFNGNSWVKELMIIKEN